MQRQQRTPVTTHTKKNSTREHPAGSPYWISHLKPRHKHLEADGLPCKQIHHEWAPYGRSFGLRPQIANPSLNKAALERRPPLERCVGLASVSGPTGKQETKIPLWGRPGGFFSEATSLRCSASSDCYSLWCCWHPYEIEATVVQAGLAS